MRLVCCTAPAHRAISEVGPIHLADWQGAGARIKAGSLLPTTAFKHVPVSTGHGVPPPRMSGVLPTIMGGEGKAIIVGNEQYQAGTRAMVYPRE